MTVEELIKTRKSDRVKQLEIIKLHRNGHSITDIRTELLRQNVSVSYEAVRYHVNRYRNRRIDENMLDNIDEQSKCQRRPENIRK